MYKRQSQKNLFFEGSAHVPLLIMPPQGRSLPHNISVEAPTDLVDIYPTILAMAGLSSPVSVSGKNLLEPVPMDRMFFGNSLNKNFCVMEEKVKLVYSAVGDHVLLFDLNTDPCLLYTSSNPVGSSLFTLLIFFVVSIVLLP